MKTYFFLIFVAFAVNANGAVIVNSLSLKNSNEDVFRRGAQAFVTTYESWIITDVRLIGIGDSPSIRISIYNDYRSAPASSIATLYTGSAAGAGFGTDLRSITPTNFTFDSVELIPHTLYWIVVDNLAYYSGFDNLIWGGTLSYTNSGQYGDGYSPMATASLSDNSWGSYKSNPYVMKITAVPEPNHLVMLGLSALMFLRRSRAK